MWYASRERTVEFGGDGEEEKNALGVAIRAQLYSLHSCLAPADRNVAFKPDQKDISNSTAKETNKKYVTEDVNDAEKRKKWLKELDAWADGLFEEYPHLTVLTRFLDQTVRQQPDGNVVVFSQHSKYSKLSQDVPRF